jgi:hypothetical protein
MTAQEHEGRAHRNCESCAVGTFLNSLHEAAPDATDRLLNAATELIHVARAVLDAAEDAIEQQRAVNVERRAPRVTRIDIA